ncbi:MAG TPA: hypothetical protein VKU38_02180 [Ktedonobacteraceae bacterium]|nr:hypothetical protein [Ktedonobacteraceae bacterium]
MPKNLLSPKNLRWLTVYLFLGLMVLLLALNLFVPSNSGASANNTTQTPTTQGAVIICQKVLHVSCKQAEHIVGTANAFTATTTAAKATAVAVKATAAAAKATAAAVKATAAAAKPTVTVTATVTVTTTPGSGKNS